MNRRTQGLLLAFVGAVLLRLSLSDAYLRYVTTWMKWPVAVSGALLLALAIGPVLDLGGETAEADDDDPRDDHAGHAHGAGHGGVPRATWLLLLPGLVAFMIAPPALGSYLAERRAGEAVVTKPADVAAISAGTDVPIEISEFLWRTQDGGTTLADRTVDLTGFVTYDDTGKWYVTKLQISCCAADAVSFRVQVDGAPAPPRDQWVTVSGTHQGDTGKVGADGSLVSQAVITAADVKKTTAPDDTYS